ncbi:hypothetical protein EYR40_004741 [Pleurotus pulmonarius]|nr:hypothetical protein EYR36_004106 [Pleurotus pulmonarius]KAF4605949.1 hypothetical protein EYR40_004741 [Pleurotus pulmonarius]
MTKGESLPISPRRRLDVDPSGLWHRYELRSPPVRRLLLQAPKNVKSRGSGLEDDSRGQKTAMTYRLSTPFTAKTRDNMRDLLAPRKKDGVYLHDKRIAYDEGSTRLAIRFSSRARTFQDSRRADFLEDLHNAIPCLSREATSQEVSVMVTYSLAVIRTLAAKNEGSKEIVVNGE